jgi:hypothetical protein
MSYSMNITLQMVCGSTSGWDKPGGGDSGREKGTVLIFVLIVLLLLLVACFSEEVLVFLGREWL